MGGSISSLPSFLRLFACLRLSTMANTEMTTTQQSPHGTDYAFSAMNCCAAQRWTVLSVGAFSSAPNDATIIVIMVVVIIPVITSAERKTGYRRSWWDTGNRRRQSHAAAVTNAHPHLVVRTVRRVRWKVRHRVGRFRRSTRSRQLSVYHPTLSLGDSLPGQFGRNQSKR